VAEKRIVGIVNDKGIVEEVLGKIYDFFSGEKPELAPAYVDNRHRMLRTGAEEFLKTPVKR
jgi:hypothetical protein